MGNIKLKQGKYRHFKGDHYEVLGVASHSETLEKFVVYRALYGKKSLWVRPIDMFTENINVGGKMIPRFKYVDDSGEK